MADGIFVRDLGDSVSVVIGRDLGDRIHRDYETTLPKPPGPDWRREVTEQALEEWRRLNRWREGAAEAAPVHDFDGRASRLATLRESLVLVMVIGAFFVGGFGVYQVGALAGQREVEATITPEFIAAQWFESMSVEDRKAWLRCPAYGSVESRVYVFDWAASRGCLDGLAKAVEVASLPKDRASPDVVAALAYILSVPKPDAIAVVREQAGCLGATPDELEDKLRRLIDG